MFVKDWTTSSMTFSETVRQSAVDNSSNFSVNCKVAFSITAFRITLTGKKDWLSIDFLSWSETHELLMTVLQCWRAQCHKLSPMLCKWEVSNACSSSTIGFVAELKDMLSWATSTLDTSFPRSWQKRIGNFRDFTIAWRLMLFKHYLFCGVGVD